ncbi:MAG: hypothetical protein U1F54_04800 [Burkholderiales bacterium]
MSLKAKPVALLMLLIALVIAMTAYGLSAQRLAHDLEHLGLDVPVDVHSAHPSDITTASLDGDEEPLEAVEDSLMHASAQMQLPPQGSAASPLQRSHGSVSPERVSFPAPPRAVAEPPFRPPRADLA